MDKQVDTQTDSRSRHYIAALTIAGDFTPVSVLDLRAGQRIEHNRFGLGTIVEISGSGTDLKAKIDFDASGIKILLLKYAKIRLA